jgi:hypothetical protein
VPDCTRTIIILYHTTSMQYITVKSLHKRSVFLCEKKCLGFGRFFLPDVHTDAIVLLRCSFRPVFTLKMTQKHNGAFCVHPIGIDSNYTQSDIYPKHEVPDSFAGHCPRQIPIVLVHTLSGTTITIKLPPISIL